MAGADRPNDIPSYNGTGWVRQAALAVNWLLQRSGAAGGGSSTWGAITGTLSAQTDLQAALDAKEPDITAGTTGQYWRGDKTFQTLDKTAVGLANVDNTTDLGKPVSTATQTALDAKGDKWNYATLASDFTTSSTTASDITGLAFTPAASTKYEFEIMLLMRTAAGTTGPQPGLAWPTGLSDGVVRMFASSAVNAEVIRHGNISAAVLVPNTGSSSTTTSYMGGGNGFVIAGASPSGDVKVQFASEVAASTVTAKAGSFIRWRIIA